MIVGISHISIPKGRPICRQPVIEVANPWNLHCLDCGENWMFEKQTPFAGKFSEHKEIVIGCPRCSVPHAVEIKDGKYLIARCVT